jgi:DNA-binding IclR family transcriptional regulator
MPDDTVDRLEAAGLLVAKTPFTVTDKSILMQQLATIRAQGYASTREENAPGAAAMAVAVRDWSGRVVASLSIAAPRERLPESRILELATVLCETGREVSRALGWK